MAKWGAWNTSTTIEGSSDSDKTKSKTESARADKKSPKTAPPKDSNAETPAKQAVHSGFTIVNVEPGVDLQASLASHVKLAKAANLTPYAEVWATWCGPCKAIESSIDTPAMAKAFKGTYLIRLDGDKWADKLGNVGMSNGIIPVFYELDEAGKASKRTINGDAWGDNTPENMAPPLEAFFQRNDA